MRLYCKTCRGHRRHREIAGKLTCFGCEPPKLRKSSGAILSATLGLASAAMGNGYTHKKGGAS